MAKISGRVDSGGVHVIRTCTLIHEVNLTDYKSQNFINMFKYYILTNLKQGKSQTSK